MKIVTNQPDGRWLWPFRKMKQGDVFYVDPAQRSAANIRTIAYARGYEMGKRFSVKLDDETGLVKVECVDPNTARHNRAPATIEFDTMRKRLRSTYGLGVWEVDGCCRWTSMEMNERVERRGLTRKRGFPVRRNMIVDMLNCRFHVEMLEDGFSVRRVRDDMTYHEFVQDHERTLELMS